MWQDLKISYSLPNSPSEKITEKVNYISEENKSYTYLPKANLILAHIQSQQENIKLIRKLTITNLLSYSHDLTINQLFLTKDDFQNNLPTRTFEDFEQIPCKKCFYITSYSKDDWPCTKCKDVYCQNCAEENDFYDSNKDWICSKCK